MKKALISIVILTFCIFAACISQNVKETLANPISVPYVPDIRISYPLTSIHGFVNSTVNFEIYVNLFQTQTLDNISYSLDGQPKVNLQDLTIVSYNDIAYVNGRPDKVEFKTYTAKLRLDNLSEGAHTLMAYTGNLSASQSFTVDSHFVIAELKTLSPNGQTYFDTIPLTFTVNGEIQSAHYYVYKSKELVFDKALNGNATLENLPEGNYDLYLFVTTELGQTSETTYFSVSNTDPTENLLIMSGLIALIILCIVVCLIFLLKKNKRKTPKTA
jgi:hypothetical protein